jgi:hypothetical protein
MPIGDDRKDASDTVHCGAQQDNGTNPAHSSVSSSNYDVQLHIMSIQFPKK